MASNRGLLANPNAPAITRLQANTPMQQTSATQPTLNPASVAQPAPQQTGMPPAQAGTGQTPAQPLVPKPGNKALQVGQVPFAQSVQDYESALGFDPAIHSVQGQLEGLLSTDNKLVQQARDRAGLESANRGLRNSSIALQAGEEAAYAAALPIAQADAELQMQSRLAAFGAAVDDQMLQKQHGFDLDKIAIEYENNRGLAEQAFGFNKALAEQGFGFNKALAEQGFGFEKALGEQQFGFNTALADQTFGFNKQLAHIEGGYQMSAAELAAETQRKNAILSAATQKDIAGMQIKASAAELAKQQAFQAGETAADRDWRGEQTQIQQEFQAGETAAEREWKAAQNQLDQDFKSAQAGLDREQQTLLATTEMSWKTTENQLDRELKELLAGEEISANQKGALSNNFTNLMMSTDSAISNVLMSDLKPADKQREIARLQSQAQANWRALKDYYDGSEETLAGVGL